MERTVVGSNALVALTTCADRAEAERVAEALIGQRLAACVNIVPDIASVYRWAGNIERGKEVLLLIKTTADRFDALQRAIGSMSSYELPEVLGVSVAAGSDAYLRWIESSVEE
jgi:periplasmic divalent cation tolerance protein